MIQVIISKGFINDLISSEIESQEYIFNFFNKLAPYQFTTDMNADTFFQLQVKFPFLRKLTTPVVNYRFLPFELSVENIEVNFISNISHHTKFILVDFNNEKCELMRKSKGIFFSNVNMFEFSFETFFLNPPKTWNINELWIGINSERKRNFKNWKDMTESISVSSFYLISDRYCLDFADMTAIRNNLAKLLGCLINDLPLNIIPTIYINTIIAKESIPKEVTPESLLKNLINSFTKREYNLKIFNISLTKKNRIELDDHSRFIASNYYFLQSDHSFNYFDDTNELKVKKCRILDNFIFTQEYGYYFMEDFYQKFNQILKSENTSSI